MPQPHALIAGAGIGGLTAALCLARQGWRVSLFEQAPVLEEVGAGLQLSPNASSILRRIGVLPHLVKAALQPRELILRRARDASALLTLPLLDAESRWGAPYLVAHRADLQRALLETLAAHKDISLMLGMEVAGFATHGQGIRLVVKQGAVKRTFEGDCLIGADGVHSFIRARLLAAAGLPPAQPTGRRQRIAWRALVPAEKVSADLLLPRTNLWLGADTHLVHYPLRQGKVVNVVAVVETASAASAKEPFWAGSGDPTVLARRFSNWAKPARDLLAAAPQWRTHPLVAFPPLPFWSAARVTLLGDAAHPMLPFLAQGAAQAIEDAAALASALRKPGNIEAAFQAYQSVRLARASRVQAASHKQASLYHLKGPAAFARDMVMRFTAPEQALARYDWLYQPQNYPQDHLT